MLIEIIGGKSEKVDKEVKIIYKDGEAGCYNPETTQKIIVNPTKITSIIIKQ